MKSGTFHALPLALQRSLSPRMHTVQWWPVAQAIAALHPSRPAINAWQADEFKRLGRAAGRDVAVGTLHTLQHALQLGSRTAFLRACARPLPWARAPLRPAHFVAEDVMAAHAPSTSPLAPARRPRQRSRSLDSADLPALLRRGWAGRGGVSAGTGAPEQRLRGEKAPHDDGCGLLPSNTVYGPTHMRQGTGGAAGTGGEAVQLLSHNLNVLPVGANMVSRHSSHQAGTRIDAFAAYLAQHAQRGGALHILALQEVFATAMSPFVCYQASLLRRLRALGYTHAVHMPRPSLGDVAWRGKWTDSGLVIASKLPIIASDFLAFQGGRGLDAGAAKGVIWARVQVPGRPASSTAPVCVDVFNCHLQATHTGPVGGYQHVRAGQVQEMMAFIRRVTHGSAHPWLLTGDFNVDGMQDFPGRQVGLPYFAPLTSSGGVAEGDSEAYTVLLAQLLQSVGRQSLGARGSAGAATARLAGFMDVLRAKHGRQVTTRPPRQQFPTHLAYAYAHKHPQRLDYVWFREGAAGQLTVDVPATAVLPFRMAPHSGFSHLSDHYGITVSLVPDTSIAWEDTTRRIVLAQPHAARHAPPRGLARSKSSGDVAGLTDAEPSEAPVLGSEAGRVALPTTGVTRAFVAPPALVRCVRMPQPSSVVGQVALATCPRLWREVQFFALHSRTWAIVGNVATVLLAFWVLAFAAAQGLLGEQHGIVSTLKAAAAGVGAAWRHRPSIDTCMAVSTESGCWLHVGQFLTTLGATLLTVAVLAAVAWPDTASLALAWYSLYWRVQGRLVPRGTREASALRLLRCAQWCPRVCGVCVPALRRCGRAVRGAGHLRHALRLPGCPPTQGTCSAVHLHVVGRPAVQVPGLRPGMPGTLDDGSEVHLLHPAATAVHECGTVGVEQAHLAQCVLQFLAASGVERRLFPLVTSTSRSGLPSAWRCFLSHTAPGEPGANLPIPVLRWPSATGEGSRGYGASHQRNVSELFCAQAEQGVPRGSAFPGSGLPQGYGAAPRLVDGQSSGHTGTVHLSSLPSYTPQYVVLTLLRWAARQAEPDLPRGVTSSPLCLTPSSAEVPQDSAFFQCCTAYEGIMMGVQQHGTRPGVGWQGDAAEGHGFSWWCHDDVAALGTSLGSGLVRLGRLAAGGRVGILATNCREWLLTDVACAFYSLHSLALHAPSSEALGRLLTIGRPAVVVTHRKFTHAVIRWAQARGADTPPPVVVQIEPVGYHERMAALEAAVELHDMTFVLEAGQAYPLAHCLPLPQDAATSVYTWGDDGAGAVPVPTEHCLSHSDFVSAVARFRCSVQGSLLSTADTHLCHLPLPHLTERIVAHTLLRLGAKVAFVGGGLNAALGCLGALQPTLLCVTPRLLEVLFSHFLRIRRAWATWYSKAYLASVSAKAAAVQGGWAALAKGLTGAAPPPSAGQASEAVTLLSPARRWEDATFFHDASHALGTARLKFMMVLATGDSGGVAPRADVLEFAQVAMCTPLVEVVTHPTRGILLTRPMKLPVVPAASGAGADLSPARQAILRLATHVPLGHPTPGTVLQLEQVPGNCRLWHMRVGRCPLGSSPRGTGAGGDQPPSRAPDDAGWLATRVAGKWVLAGHSSSLADTPWGPLCLHRLESFVHCACSLLRKVWLVPPPLHTPTAPVLALAAVSSEQAFSWATGSGVAELAAPADAGAICDHPATQQYVLRRLQAAMQVRDTHLTPSEERCLGAVRRITLLPALGRAGAMVVTPTGELLRRQLASVHRSTLLHMYTAAGLSEADAERCVGAPSE